MGDALKTSLSPAGERIGVRGKRLLFTFWLTCGVLLPLSVIRPETSSASKLLTSLSLLGLLTIPITLLLPHRRLRALALGITVPVLLGLALPAREVDANALRDAYLTELRTYDAATYVWGGENHRGIDCSGLVRKGLVDATASEAVRRIDAGLTRRALELWWFDASAQALGEGYRGWTHEVTRAPDFASLDPALLRQGDLAVTQDGLHVLAYLGDSTWIQADPVPMRVHVDRASGTGWFTHPISVVRWRLLD